MAGKFDLKMYPEYLRDAFNKGPMFWMVAIQRAKEENYRHINMLTDLVFHMHHPELHQRSILPGESELIKQWNAFKYSIKQAIGYTASKPSLQKLLADADVSRPVPTGTQTYARQIEAIAKLRSFLLRMLSGEKLDDSYWSYSFRCKDDHVHSASEKDNILSLERLMKQHALARFKDGAKHAETPGDAAKALFVVERALAQHVFLVIRWATQTSGMADGSMTGYTEYRYLRELYDSVIQKSSSSVYWPYERDIILTYKNVS